MRWEASIWPAAPSSPRRPRRHPARQLLVFVGPGKRPGLGNFPRGYRPNGVGGQDGVGAAGDGNASALAGIVLERILSRLRTSCELFLCVGFAFVFLCVYVCMCLCVCVFYVFQLCVFNCLFCVCVYFFGLVFVRFLFCCLC